MQDQVKDFSLGTTTVNAKVCRIDKPTLCREVEMVVDTGAHVSVIPQAVAKQLGIKFPYKRQFTLADGRKVSRRVGAVQITVGDRTTSDDVIALAKGKSLLSVRALEGMALQVDPMTQKLKKQDASLLL